MPSTITLSRAIGATDVQVRSAGLPDGAGGVALRFMTCDGPIAFTLTDQETRQVIELMHAQLTTPAVRSMLSQST